jgi:DNA helicase II / ATP-dependent DNA helicase PcrA
VKLTMDYLQELNEVQRHAVQAINGPVLVIAGPGSGKTRVLTYRIAYLIDSGIRPNQILALTFTNKAAREMKERITAVVGDQAYQVWTGTFHSIFARILRVEAKHIGFPSDFTIYDTDDSKSLINSIIKDMQLDPKIYISNSIRNRISSAKSNLITPKAYAEDAALLQADAGSSMSRMYEIYARYVARCQRAGAMDFDDLLYQMFRLLHQNPENVLEKYQNRFQHLLVDEFQDTNYLQYAIIKKLTLYPNSPQNICAVGDDAQSIYAFRGATIDNILNFEKDFPTIQTFKLEQNYRSTHAIVQAANGVITFNKKQIKKEIWTERIDGDKIKLIKAMSDTEEAKRVADLIQEQKNRYHLQNREIAILYRTNAQSRLFEEYLRRYNLPYKVYGGQSFYNRKEVKDLLAYLRLTVNPRDDEAFRRIVNYPRRGIGNTSLDKVIQDANAKGISYWESAVEQAKTNPQQVKQLLKFLQMMAEIMQKSQTVSAYDLALYTASKSGMLAELKQDTSIEGVGRLENVQALLDGIKSFVENDELIPGQETDDKTLSSFLQSVALITDQDEGQEADDRIALMSVHAAKGLEFRSVFVVGLEENLFPSAMALSQKEGLDEERRLFYVAITRAKEILSLGYAKSRYRFGQMKYSEPSRFISEISGEHFDQSSAATISRDLVQKSGVSGALFRKPVLVQKPFANKSDEHFAASPSSLILPGVKVLHQRFGQGQVLKIEGSNESKVATIKFENSFDEEKKIMLKFAKLQVIDN